MGASPYDFLFCFACQVSQWSAAVIVPYPIMIFFIYYIFKSEKNVSESPPPPPPPPRATFSGLAQNFIAGAAVARHFGNFATHPSPQANTLAPPLHERKRMYISGTSTIMSTCLGYFFLHFFGYYNSRMVMPNQQHSNIFRIRRIVIPI